MKLFTEIEEKESDETFSIAMIENWGIYWDEKRYAEPIRTI